MSPIPTCQSERPSHPLGKYSPDVFYTNVSEPSTYKDSMEITYYVSYGVDDELHLGKQHLEISSIAKESMSTSM